MLRTMRALGAICSVAVLAACGGSAEDTSGSAEEQSGDFAGWPETIRVGVVPVEGGADTVERYAPLEDFLTEELGRTVEVVSASSYQGVITAMANDQIEFARFGPDGYTEAARRADAEALVCEINLDGKQGYHSIFIVPNESPIRTLAQARGAEFAFTDPNSTSGYLIPATIIHDEFGQAAEHFFGEVHFSGAHGTSMLQVASGELEIAASNDLDLDRMIQKGALEPDDVRVVYRSEMIPGSPFAGRRSLPASLKEAFINAMLGVNDREDMRERFQLSGYARVNDEVYDIIRATKRYLESQRRASADAETSDGTDP